MQQVDYSRTQPASHRPCRSVLTDEIVKVRAYIFAHTWHFCLKI